LYKGLATAKNENLKYQTMPLVKFKCKMERTSSVLIALPNNDIFQLQVEKKANCHFRYPKYSGIEKDVFIVGSWDGWNRHHKLGAAVSEYHLSLKLPIGEHEYKFVIDNEECVSLTSLNRIRDDRKHVNVIVAEEQDVPKVIDGETILTHSIKYISSQLPFIPFWSAELLDSESKGYCKNGIPEGAMGTLSLKIEEPLTYTQMLFQVKIGDPYEEDELPLLCNEIVNSSLKPGSSLTQCELLEKHTQLKMAGIIKEGFQWYRTKCGELLVLNTSANACKKFGIMPGNVIRTPALGYGTCKGEYGGNLWFHLKMHSGVSYWNNGENFEKFRTAVQMSVESYVSQKAVNDFNADMLDESLSGHTLRYWKQSIYQKLPEKNFEPWLPVELLVEIFLYLTMFKDRISASIVCRVWNEASKSI
jgi:hypothetical protein